MRRHLLMYLSLVVFGSTGCGALEKKPYRDDPMLQSRPPVIGGRIPPQNIIQSEPSPPMKPKER